MSSRAPVILEPGCGCRLELRNGRWVRAVTCASLAGCRAKGLTETGGALAGRRGFTVTATRRPPR